MDISPWETDELLNELVRRGWTLWLCGRREAPDVLAATLKSPECTDVVVIRSEDLATAWRVLNGKHSDPLNPEFVVWHYLNTSTVWTLRAVLSLPSADQMAAYVYPAPVDCCLPEAELKPVTIRPTTARTT
ncbi:hypothetical protein D5S17_18530 [Pseudonocardiaceae bacterium YIM PH 21723]|nr:hypothetical protein D5S17_18530 [Pseudonocardiaceae bacterium YIM PH 21723]